MSTSILMQDLSLESSEAPLDDVETTGIFVDPMKAPDQSEDFDDMMLVFETYSTVVNRRFICRSDLERIKGLTGKYPALGKLVKRYPINSFTEEPSTNNYEVATESFLRSAYEAVVKGLRAVLDFIVNSMKRLWKFLSDNGQRTAAVDDIRDKLTEIQRYIVDVDRVMQDEQFAEDYKKVRDGAIDIQLNNISKRWNGFKQTALVDREKLNGMADVVTNVLKTKVGPFVMVVEEFLKELARAETDTDVTAAIDRIKMANMWDVELNTLATEFGWNLKNIKLGEGVTLFQGVTGYLLASYRSWDNKRIPLERTDFVDAINGYQIDKWADKINETIKWSSSRTDRLLTEINNFNEDSLRPQLEDAYIQQLVPFFRVLSSTIQGFTSLEQCLGMLVTTRDNVAIAMAKGSLEVAKSIDSFVVKNKDKLSVMSRAAVGNRRKALVAHF